MNSLKTMDLRRYIFLNFFILLYTVVSSPFKNRVSIYLLYKYYFYDILRNICYIKYCKENTSKWFPCSKNRLFCWYLHILLNITEYLTQNYKSYGSLHSQIYLMVFDVNPMHWIFRIVDSLMALNFTFFITDFPILKSVFH